LWRSPDGTLATADDAHLLLPILERRAYAAAMRDREGAAKLAAIANLPFDWVFEEPRPEGGMLILIEVSGGSTEGAWRAMAHKLAARGQRG
jgi:hypothetical protein